MIVQHSIEHYCVAGMTPRGSGAGSFILVSPLASSMEPPTGARRGITNKHADRYLITFVYSTVKEYYGYDQWINLNWN